MVPITRRFACLRLIVAGLCLVALTAGCARGGVPADSPGATSRGLVYADGERLWVVEPDAPGTPRREFVKAVERGQVSDPAWSPDGRQVAYSHSAPAAGGASYGADIFVAQADGSAPRALFTHDTDGGFARSPAWTPDGTSLYFSYATTVQRPGQAAPERIQQLVRLEIATGTLANIAENAHYPTVSPDGKQIVFLRYSEDIADAPSLWIARADGSDARPLTPRSKFKAVWSPQFSPDGAFVLFSAHAPAPAQPRLRVQRPGSAGLSWAPSVRAHGYPMDLWLIEIATGRLELLAALGADDLETTWAPDGKRLALLSSDGVFILDLATAAVTRLPSATDGFGALDWAR